MSNREGSREAGKGGAGDREGRAGWESERVAGRVRTRTNASREGGAGQAAGR